VYLSQPISQPFGTTCEISHCVIDKMAMWAGRGRWEAAVCAVLSRPWRQIYDNINNLAAKESKLETRSLPIRIRIPIRIRGIRLARNFMTQQKLSTAARRQIAYKTTKSIKWWGKKKNGEACNVWPSYRYIHTYADIYCKSCLPHINWNFRKRNLRGKWCAQAELFSICAKSFGFG